MKVLLSLLCLGFIALAASRPAFQAVNYFNAKKLQGVNWYELIFASTFTYELIACPREVYTSIGNGKMTYQYGQYVPGIDGDFESLLLVIKQIGNSGKFKVVNNNGANEYYYVLDFDKNYEWIVFAVDFEGDDQDVVVLISKSTENLTGIQRALDFAKKNDLDSHHLELQSTTCDYDNIFDKLKKERKYL